MSRGREGYVKRRLFGLMVKASSSRVVIRASIHPCTLGFFSRSSHTGAVQRLPSKAPGVIGSALGLVGPVSVYRDRVR